MIPTTATPAGLHDYVTGRVLSRCARTGDAADLAATLAPLLDDPQRTAELARRARQRVLESFSRRYMIEAHARVYCQIGGVGKPE